MFSRRFSESCWLTILEALVFLTLCILFFTPSTSHACFIRNCPLGGKRAVDSHTSSNWHTKHGCLQCGPDGQGQCIGPKICCGADIGCFMNTEETQVCEAENDNPIPCEIVGDECGPRGDGHCVGQGMCCTDEKCTLDAMCDNHNSYHNNMDNDMDLKTSDMESLNEALQHTLRSRQKMNNPLQFYIERLLREAEFKKK